MFFQVNLLELYWSVVNQFRHQMIVVLNDSPVGNTFNQILMQSTEESRDLIFGIHVVPPVGNTSISINKFDAL